MTAIETVKLDLPREDSPALASTVLEFAGRIESYDGIFAAILRATAPAATQSNVGNYIKFIEPVLGGFADLVESWAIGLDAADAIRAHYERENAPKAGRKARKHGNQPHPSQRGKKLDSVIQEIRRLTTAGAHPMLNDIIEATGYAPGTTAIILGQAVRRGLIIRAPDGTCSLPQAQIPIPAPEQPPAATETTPPAASE